ncbi:MAG: ABC transporter ATP-binding protein/permease [Acidimicrobiia bacterium]|nr:ABC transporter ATP-binding protein/permease [Acidimicrobiia bacterium]NNL29117.1 ABC transporter ATP-binding protein [Acidimicrobiia bacterium]
MHGGWFSYLRYDENQAAPNIDRDVLRRVFEYARPYLRYLIIVLVSIAFIGIVTLAPPLLIRDLIDIAIPAKDIGRVTLLGIGMVAVPLLNGAIGLVQRWASSTAGEGIIFDLRRQLFGHLGSMSLGFFTNTRTGELNSRLNNDVVGAQQAITGTLVSLVSNAFSTIVTIAVMLGIEWRLTLLSIVVLPLFVIPSRRVGKLLRGIARDQMVSQAEMNNSISEALNVSGALLAKLFGRGQTEIDRFTEHASEVKRLGIRRALVGRWFFMALGIVSAVGTSLVFWFGAVLVINGELDIGDVVALSLYLGNLYGPLSSLSNAKVEFSTSMVSFERVFEVMDIRAEIREKPDAVALEPVVGAVEFDDVSFDYAAAVETGLASVQRVSFWTPAVLDGDPVKVQSRGPALQNVSFAIQPGELVALVGRSGAGKTTATYLVPRLYDVTSGAVRIDGVDVRDLSFSTLSGSIGVVTQESHLFHDSVAANLRYAKPDATTEELARAAEIANIREFIESLADGYETRVGERGYRLSGGEKQRLAIARVVLKDPRILILDEATSHLDAHNEALIQQALDRVMAGRTSLVIAHRLSTVLAADRILVLEEGRLIESGTHSELVAEGGLYADLFETQFRAGTVPS